MSNKQKKEHKPIVEYLLSSGSIYAFTVIFSILGFVFLTESIEGIWKIIMGILFMAPTLVICFNNGKSAGEKEYKKYNKDVLSDIHVRRYTEVKLYKSIFHVLPYAISALTLILIAEIFQWQFLQGAMIMLFISSSLVFIGFGVLDISKLTWLSVLPIAIFVILASGMFILGYVLGVINLRRRSADLVNEIRNVG